MTPHRRPLRAVLTSSAVALTAAIAVSAVGTPLAGAEPGGTGGDPGAVTDLSSLQPIYDDPSLIAGPVNMINGSLAGLGSVGPVPGSTTPTTLPTSTQPPTTPPTTTPDPGPAPALELVRPDAEPLWPEGGPVENRIVPKQNTVIAAAGSVVSVAGDAGSTQSTVLTADQADLVVVGSYFVVNIGPGSPSGVIGRVTAVTVLPSGLVQVTTDPAGIQDAYDEFSINTTVRLSDAVSSDAGAGGSAPRVRSAQSRSGATLPVSPSLSWLDCVGATPDAFDADLTLSDLSARVIMDPIRGYSRIVVDYEQAATVSLAVDESAGAVECAVSADRMPSVFIPVAGPLGLRAAPTLALSGAAGSTVSTETRASRVDGVEISGRATRAISSADYSDARVRAEEGVDTAVSVGVSAQLAANIRADEPVAGMTVGPELTADWTDEDCVELSETIRVAAGAGGSALWEHDWAGAVALTRIGALEVVTECEPGGPTTTPTTTTTATTTPTPAPGFRDGAVSGLRVSNTLSCDVRSTVDGTSVFYDAEACATLLYVDGLSYGPTIPAGNDWDGGFTPVSQSTSGAGTAADPQVTRTVVAVGDTGITLTQVDYFVEGAPGYQTDITVQNASEVDKAVKAYRGVDCYLSNSDEGTGTIYGRSVACNDESGRRIAFTDLSGGAFRQEAPYSLIWDAVAAGADFDDTAWSELHDSGMGINWSVTVPAAESVVLRSRFQLDEPAASGAGGAGARVAGAGARVAAPVGAPADALAGAKARAVERTATAALPTRVPVG